MKEQKYHIYLTEQERSEVIKSLIDLKNALIRQGKYTDAVDDVLVKLTGAKRKKLKGVYNINKGYAVFKQIKILCESEEYYVVEEGNDYGLANYDHIALDSDSVKENDVVFQ